MKVLVTGASGFVGRALVGELLARGEHTVVGTVRRVVKPASCEMVETGDLPGFTGWSDALKGIDVVVHLAGRAHIPGDAGGNQLNDFRRVNVDATVSLAKAAIEAGVSRFVFLSSIGVNGAKTGTTPFSEISEPNPTADYALSKLEAEQQLKALFRDADAELVIVRPPLVYAGQAPGNFRRLLKVVRSGLPLPFSRVQNSRTMVALGNLVDFLICCINHPRAGNELFLCSDNEELPLPEIVRLLASGMGRKARLLPFPVVLLYLAASLINRRSMIDQLCGSLVVENQKAKECLGWQPPFDARSAIMAAGHDFVMLDRGESR